MQQGPWSECLPVCPNDEGVKRYAGGIAVIDQGSLPIHCDLPCRNLTSPLLVKLSELKDALKAGAANVELLEIQRSLNAEL